MRTRKPNLNGHLPNNGTTEEADRKRGLSKSRPTILTANKMPADIFGINQVGTQQYMKTKDWVKSQMSQK